MQRDFVPLVPAGRGRGVREGAAGEAGGARRRDQEAGRPRRRPPRRRSTRPRRSRTRPSARRSRRAEQARGRLKQKIKAAQKEREDFAKKPLPFETAYAVAEGKTEGKQKVGNACVQIKGDPERLGRGSAAPLPDRARRADAAGRREGQRPAASWPNWIADPTNPLTARVMVNRIWQYHFGRGIVPTPNDFGTQGQPPTHPELLDYLAARFVESGWSIKAMHRLIMLSRDVSACRAATTTANAADRRRTTTTCWRFDRRRLDAESIRDALLAVGGNLDRTPGGAAPVPATRRPGTSRSTSRSRPSTTPTAAAST